MLGESEGSLTKGNILTLVHLSLMEFRGASRCDQTGFIFTYSVGNHCVSITECTIILRKSHRQL